MVLHRGLRPHLQAPRATQADDLPHGLQKMQCMHPRTQCHRDYTRWRKTSARIHGHLPSQEAAVHSRKPPLEFLPRSNLRREVTHGISKGDLVQTCSLDIQVEAGKETWATPATLAPQPILCPRSSKPWNICFTVSKSIGPTEFNMRPQHKCDA